MKDHGRRSLFATTLCLLAGMAVLGMHASSAEEAEEPPLRKFMRAKLDVSAKILEGLTTEDYKLIETGAQSLATMSQAEQWRVSNDALYRQYSSEFQRVAERLAEQGKAKNLDGAALAWVEATMSCIECHRHARTILISGSAGAPAVRK